MMSTNQALSGYEECWPVVSVQEEDRGVDRAVRKEMCRQAVVWKREPGQSSRHFCLRVSRIQ